MGNCVISLDIIVTPTEMEVRSWVTWWKGYKRKKRILGELVLASSSDFIVLDFLRKENREATHSKLQSQMLWCLIGNDIVVVVFVFV